MAAQNDLSSKKTYGVYTERATMRALKKIAFELDINIGDALTLIINAYNANPQAPVEAAPEPPTETPEFRLARVNRLIKELDPEADDFYPTMDALFAEKKQLEEEIRDSLYKHLESN